MLGIDGAIQNLQDTFEVANGGLVLRLAAQLVEPKANKEKWLVKSIGSMSGELEYIYIT